MVPKWLHGKSIAVYDIESDKIPTTLIYMIGVAIINIDLQGNITRTSSRIFTYKWVPYSTGSLMQAVSLINTCDYHAGHNSVGFDDRELIKHLNIDITTPHLDTIILSKIVFSKDELFVIDAQLKIDKHLLGKYSLEAFGQRLGGKGKIQFSDFSKMTDEMHIYCNQDVNLSGDLLVFLLGKDNFPTEDVVLIEHQAAKIIAEQTEFGFYLDIGMARALNIKLLTEKLEIAAELAKTFKPKWLKDGKVKTYKKLSTTRRYLPNTKYIPLLGTAL